MSSRVRSMAIGMSGFFAGAFVASITHIEPWSKAAVVVIVSALVSSLAYALLRPKGDQLKAPWSRTTDSDGNSRL
jgi:hypothetical protein